MWVWNKPEHVKNKLKKYMNMDQFPKIQGYDFSQPFNFKEFSQTYLNMGFQGSHVGMAMEIFSQMLQEKQNGLQIFLSMTGNMISSGNRELITFLIKHDLIDGITTTAAALEEDVMKCIKPFHLGSFEVKGKLLLDECIGRIGNLFVPADRYLYFERFLNELFPLLYEKQKKSNPLCTHEVAKEMGVFIEHNELTKERCKESFLYWAAQKNIPIYCPGITDGTFGDISTFFRKNHPDFVIDMVKDNDALTKQLMNCDRAASIILGGGIAKHFLMNSAIFRDGFEYSIYITTATEYDGSDSGGNQEEAISWAKIKPDAQRIKVTADATIVFPLLVASVFANP